MFFVNKAALQCLTLQQTQQERAELALCLIPAAKSDAVHNAPGTCLGREVKHLGVFSVSFFVSSCYSSFLLF